MSLQWQVHPDGSFDLMTPGPCLRNGYPALDGEALRPVAVRISSEQGTTEIAYRLSEGELVLRLRVDGGVAVLAASLRGLRQAPHRVEPCVAQVEQAPRAFRQGLGFAGPSGLVDLDPSGDLWSYDSYTVTGLCGQDGGTLVVAAHDHSRFLQKCILRNAVGHWGLVNRHVHETRVELAAAFHTENIPLPEGRLDLPELHFRYADAADDALHATADAIARQMGARAATPPTYHWCSWYYAYHNLSQELLEEYLDGMRKLSPPVPLQAIQIDAGYYTHAGDWLEPNHLWPGGMEAAFRAIREAGYRPGVWIAPFMVGNRSRLAEEHPDWILRDADGQPVTEWRWYGGNAIWGYRDEEYYVLDTSHPDAFGYLRSVFRTLRGWGATFFKTDFMDWGLKDSTRVRRHTPGTTSVEHFRQVLSMIREEIGEESHWLACIAPYAPFIGFADSTRIANDISVTWSAGSTGNMIRESVANQYFNNVWWQNDPDVIYLRDFHINLSESEIRSLAYWQAILGGSINTSAPLHRIAPERLRLWRFLEPSQERWTARLPYWEQKRKLRVAVREFPDLGSWAVLALNPTEEPVAERLKLAGLVGRERAHCYSWGPEGSNLLGDWSFVTPQLAPHESILYYLSANGAPPPADLTLGGARTLPPLAREPNE